MPSACWRWCPSSSRESDAAQHSRSLLSSKGEAKMRRAIERLVTLVTLAATGLLPGTAVRAEDAPHAAGAGIGEVQLFGEEDVQIEAATKTSIPLSKAPGAVTVVTARQIRESGARTIPEVLR